MEHIALCEHTGLFLLRRINHPRPDSSRGRFFVLNVLGCLKNHIRELPLIKTFLCKTGDQMITGLLWGIGLFAYMSVAHAVLKIFYPKQELGQYVWLKFAVVSDVSFMHVILIVLLFCVGASLLIESIRCFAIFVTKIISTHRIVVWPVALLFCGLYGLYFNGTWALLIAQSVGGLILTVALLKNGWVASATASTLSSTLILMPAMLFPSFISPLELFIRFAPPLF